MKEEIKQRIDENGFSLHLKAYSKSDEPDWYGDYAYDDNPLECFEHCTKQSVYIPHYARGRGIGIESVDVYTTKEFLEMMGWEYLVKYDQKETDDYINKRNNKIETIKSDLLI